MVVSIQCLSVRLFHPSACLDPVLLEVASVV